MGLDASVKVVIGFPIKVLDICEVVDVPSCSHPERDGAKFCPVCGEPVESFDGLVLKDATRAPIDWLDVAEVVNIAGVGLIDRLADCEDSIKDDDRYLCGIEVGKAKVIRETKAGAISLDVIGPALIRVQQAHACIPGALPIEIHILPHLSY